jgi:RNA polymerase sigma-70 factor (ECF subfamily)
VKGQQGDASSVDIEVTGFDGFFHEHHAAIVRALSLALGDEHLGRDAASEGFARALQRWNKVSRYDNPTGWVYRVGLNWGRSRWRKTRREVSAAAGHGHERQVEQAEFDPRLPDALARLSTEHRAVIVARFHFDWSEQEIADALGIRPGTVKSRLSRALERLAVDLGSN